MYCTIISHFVDHVLLLYEFDHLEGSCPFGGHENLLQTSIAPRQCSFATSFIVIRCWFLHSRLLPIFEDLFPLELVVRGHFRSLLNKKFVNCSLVDGTGESGTGGS